MEYGVLLIVAQLKSSNPNPCLCIANGLGLISTKPADRSKLDPECSKGKNLRGEFLSD